VFNEEKQSKGNVGVLNSRNVTLMQPIDISYSNKNTNLW